MVDDLVFPEPGSARLGPLGGAEPQVNFYLESTRPEASAARAWINAAYRDFPDSNHRLKSLLRSTDNIQHISALDELFYLQKLHASSRSITHEEGGVGPDFRVYTDGEYLAAVEVCSLLENRDWEDQQTRHARIADEVNKRIPLADWFVFFDVVQLDRQPSIKRLVAWLNQKLSELSDNNEDATTDSIIRDIFYIDDGVQLDFSFIRRSATTPARPTDRIIGSGQMVGGYVDTHIRVRSALEKKVQKRYETRGKPLAIAMGMWDTFGEVDELEAALFGNEAVVVSTGQLVRSNNGFFGRSRERPEGKHRDISCIFVRQNWYPWSDRPAVMFRYDNPFAIEPFPADLINVDYSFEAVRSPTSVRMEWCPEHPAQPMPT